MNLPRNTTLAILLTGIQLKVCSHGKMKSVCQVSNNKIQNFILPGELVDIDDDQ